MNRNRRRLRNNNRRKLIERWQNENGQQIRTKVLASLREHKVLPDDLFVLTGEDLSEEQQAQGADLRCINLSGENLDGVDLSKARLQGANLARSSLKGAFLMGANLSDALLRRTDFTDADLREACLHDAVIEKTVFENANLENIVITRQTTIAKTDFPQSVTQSKSSPWFADRFSSRQMEEIME